ncbi:MAG: proton-conducting transporter membrane subunit [Candidatus Omnitrophota bacterium]
MLPLFVIISLGAAFLIALFGRKSKLFCDIAGSLSTFILFVLSVYSLVVVKQSGAVVYKIGGWVLPLGICFVLDGLSAFMLVILNLVSFLIAVYSISYMEKYTDKFRFYCLFMLMVAGMNGIIITGDIFNLFVFLEIASVASYALVAFGTEAEELEAAFKYAVMGAIASSFILLGIAFLYAYASTLNMADMALIIAQKGFSTVILFVSVLFIAGFGIKSALFPFHAWLPDAHPSAPASISAMLSGLLIKILGVYALMRIFFNIFGISSNILSILMILGIISMAVGGLLAIGQQDIKRMFAYSSISQMGYVFLGLGIATPLAIIGALYHLVNHAISKSLLFLNSGAIEYSTGTRDLDKMGGINTRMPVTGYTSLIGSLSISGIPPFGGFWSKLIIIIAAVKAGYLTGAIVATLVSILTLAYYLRFQKNAMFGNLKQDLSKIIEVPLSMKLSMILLAFLCLMGGILLIPAVSAYFLEPATEVLVSGSDYAFTVLGGKPL